LFIWRDFFATHNVVAHTIATNTAIQNTARKKIFYIFVRFGRCHVYILYFLMKKSTKWLRVVFVKENLDFGPGVKMRCCVVGQIKT
jgi:hypothetical protein